MYKILFERLVLIFCYVLDNVFMIDTTKTFLSSKVYFKELEENAVTIWSKIVWINKTSRITALRQLSRRLKHVVRIFADVSILRCPGIQTVYV